MNQIDLISLYTVYTQHLEEVCWERRSDFFQGGFHIKNKLKSEIFNDKKKFISKSIFLCHN